MAGFIRCDTDKLTILSTVQLNKDKDMNYSGEAMQRGRGACLTGNSTTQSFMVFNLIFNVTPLEKEAPKHSF